MPPAPNAPPPSAAHSPRDRPTAPAPNGSKGLAERSAAPARTPPPDARGPGAALRGAVPRPLAQGRLSPPAPAPAPAPAVLQGTGSGGAPPRQLSARANAAGRRDGAERGADEPLQRLRLPNRLALLAGDTPSAPHRGTQRPPGLLGAGGAKAVSAKWGAVETPGAPPPPPPPSLRTNRTRRVLHPVLIGHAVSLTPY